VTRAMRVAGLLVLPAAHTDIQRCAHLAESVCETICFLLALAGCSNEQTQKITRAPGWTKSLDKYRNDVFFRFAVASDTTFSGICASRPVFGLYGGSYPALSERFTLTIDRQSSELRAFQGEHGRSLPVDDPQFVELFRGAKQRMAFRVGPNWVRSFRPNSLPQAFVDQCRVRRIRGPEANDI